MAALGLWGPGATAQAQDEVELAPPPPPEDDDARAREQFKLGQAAYEEGDYRSAWEHFHKAYMLSKRPELLYNVGQTADRLRKDREALKAFRMYLQRLPDAENRREVENRVRVLEERVEGAKSEDGADDAGEAHDDSPFQKVSEDSEPFHQASEEDDADELAPPAPEGAQPLRKGWYFRGALGLGAFRSSQSAATASGAETTLSSSTASGELAIGHDILPGLVVGGGVFFDFGLAPKIEDLEIDRANLTMLGVIGDWYLRPDHDGLHLQAAVAVGSLSARDSTGGGGVSPEGYTGGALIAGGGYEWPIQDDWALGILGRLTLARLSSDVNDATLFAISAQASATWF